MKMPLQGLKSRKGFTLLEMMIVMAISSMIAYSIFAVMRAGQEQAQSANTRMTIYDGAREGLYKMVQEIRMSAPGRIAILNAGSRIQFSVPNPASPTNADYTINWNGSSMITYSLGGTNGRQVLRTDPNGNVAVIANDVVALNFTGNAAQPSVVTVSLSVQRTLTNGRVIPAAALQVTGQAEVRNI